MKSIKRFLSWVAYNLAFAIMVWAAGSFTQLYWPIVVLFAIYAGVAFICTLAGITLLLIPLDTLDIKIKPFKKLAEIPDTVAYFYPNLIVDIALIIGAANFAGITLSCIYLILFFICMVNVELTQLVKERLNKLLGRQR